MRLLVFLITVTPLIVSAKEYPFGRLFTTPQERAYLDAPAPQSQESSETILDDRVYLSGFIVREDGKNTVWINGEGIPSSQAMGNLIISNPNTSSGTVYIRQGKSAQQLKPGQVWNPNDGKVQERYQHDIP